jgi:hypothetical protein
MRKPASRAAVSFRKLAWSERSDAGAARSGLKRLRALEAAGLPKVVS